MKNYKFSRRPSVFESLANIAAINHYRGQHFYFTECKLTDDEILTDIERINTTGLNSRGCCVAGCHTFRQPNNNPRGYWKVLNLIAGTEGGLKRREICEKLNVKMPSVTGALRQLEKMNYIVYNTHYPVSLTSEGKAVADEVIRRHQVLMRFFSGILGLSLEKASETACRLEHVVDKDAVRRFVIFTEAIGSRSDAASLQTYLTEAMANLEDDKLRDATVLSSLAPGGRAQVVKYGRNLAGKAPEALKIGDTLVLQGLSLDRSLFRVSVAGKRLELSRAVAENIFVIPR